MSIATLLAPARSRPPTPTRTESCPALLTLGELAARLELPLPDHPALAAVAFPTRRLKTGDVLYRAGDAFESLYFMIAGMCKTVLVDSTGLEQVLAFPVAGDVLGMDGIDSGAYPSEAVALDDGHVAVVPFARLAQLGREDHAVERLVYRIFGRELERKHAMMWLLGTLPADARVAAFLLDLAERNRARGLSPTSFVLRMTRAELGSYLGVKLETVSRALSAFAAAGLIEVSRRSVTLCDPAGLDLVVDRERGARAIAPLRVVYPLVEEVAEPRLPEPKPAELTC